MRFPPPLLALPLLVACGPTDNLGFDGTQMVDYFPFDGTRTWDYISTDVEVSYKYTAAMRSSEPEVVEGVNVYPVDYSSVCLQNDPSCVDQIVRSFSWASDRTDGVFIYDWTEGSQTTTFEPPLMIADVEMRVGDVLSTTTAGATWTVTLEAFESCPVRMNVDWRDCAKLIIDDGDGNDATGAGLVGTYWAGPFNNIVAIQHPGEEGLWELSALDCQPEEDCRGEW